MKKRRSAGQIVGLLRQVDVDLGKGMNVPDVYRRLGISQQTYYRWRTKFGGMDPKMAKQLQERQKENSRLKKLVTEQAAWRPKVAEVDRPGAQKSLLPEGEYAPLIGHRDVGLAVAGEVGHGHLRAHATVFVDQMRLERRAALAVAHQP